MYFLFCFSVKAYIRKGAALIALKEYGKAQSAYEAALALDNNNQEARDGLMNAMSNNNEDPDAARERALRDPEVQEILKFVFIRCFHEDTETILFFLWFDFLTIFFQFITSASFRDPGMRLLLEQMSQDPGAVREHLQNPDILRKLMKLREAGIIKLR